MGLYVISEPKRVTACTCKRESKTVSVSIVFLMPIDKYTKFDGQSKADIEQGPLKEGGVDH